MADAVMRDAVHVRPEARPGYAAPRTRSAIIDLLRDLPPHKVTVSRPPRSPPGTPPPPRGISAFATVNATLRSEISTADPAPWALRLTTAASAWHTHRRAG
ncbi:hypothetical protein RB201_10085 [Streptomyces sp. S1A(2023)]